MSTASSRVPIGSYVRFEKAELSRLIAQLRELGYRVVGPRVADGAIIYDDLESAAQLPIGLLDEQDGGRYRLHREGDAYFDYVVGPHSLKQFLFPPRETLLSLTREEEGWEIEPAPAAAQPVAVLGVRGCDLAALAVQDRVFLEGPYVDPAYQARREQLLLVAVNCRRAAATCFCHSMQTGPGVKQGYDLALTELDESFVVQVGTERGGEIVAATAWAPCTMDEVHRAQKATESLRRTLEQRSVQQTPDGRPVRQRHLDTWDIHGLLLGNLEHARWNDVAQRCLSCTNCTLVCPTCFCSSVEEVSDLTGDHVRRERSWSSCFTAEHSYMNSGTVRKTIASRYRQWLTHKLATWLDQFGTSGCVGCGRCITWCPVGIDLTEEVAAIRASGGTP